MLNKRGSLLIDAMIALVLTAFGALLLVSSLHIYKEVVRMEGREYDEERIPSWFEEAGRLYDD